MNVVVGSMFRNSSSYIDRYFAQVDALRTELRRTGLSHLSLILAEGDSTDRTWEQLHAAAESFGAGDVTIVKREHGGPNFGSYDLAQRWRQISFVMAGVLERIPESAHVFVWVESDLVWQATDLQYLIDLAGLPNGYPAVTCLNVKAGEERPRHYDTWGHRGLDGKPFSQFAPYHPSLSPDEPTEILSAGSIIVAKAAIARATRCNPADEGIVGWCKDMRAKGFPLFFVPGVSVEHP